MALDELVAAIGGDAGEAVLQAPVSLAEPLAARLREQGFFVALLDGAPVFGEETLFRALHQRCGFPAYFGFNWDALLDCLSDWSWEPAQGYVLLFRDLDLLEHRAPAVAETLLEIVREARAERGAPLRLVRLVPGAE